MYSRSRVLIQLSLYEIKKNIRRFIVLALFILSILFIFGSIAIILFFQMSASTFNMPQSLFGKYEWFYVISMPGFFIGLMGIAIGGGLFSSEYEDRTSYVLYTKPLTRLDIFLGKFIGGYLLTAVLTLVYAVIGVLSSLVIFGDLDGSHAIIPVILSMIYSQLLFFSISYMFSQLTKRTLISIVICVALIIFLPIIQSMLIIFSSLLNLKYLKYVIYLLPTWANQLPTYVAMDLLPDLMPTQPIMSDSRIAILCILGYFILTTVITVISIYRSDLVKD